jgi:flagellar assembly factor FliW
MSIVAETTSVGSTTIRLPLGLLGFEHIKSYWLVANPDEEPFQWLQVPDEGDLAFLVVPPGAVAPGYQPELSDEDTRFLGIDHPDDALILNIVTLRPDGASTVNLKGPIVINRHTLTGKQVVLVNAPHALQHPLPSA